MFSVTSVADLKPFVLELADESAILLRSVEPAAFGWLTKGGVSPIVSRRVSKTLATEVTEDTEKKNEVFLGVLCNLCG